MECFAKWFYFALCLEGSITERRRVGVLGLKEAFDYGSLQIPCCIGKAVKVMHF